MRLLPAVLVDQAFTVSVEQGLQFVDLLLDHAAAVGVANAHPGVNSNLLNPPDLIDVPSNTQVVNGVPCVVEAAGPEFVNQVGS